MHSGALTTLPGRPVLDHTMDIHVEESVHLPGEVEITGKTEGCEEIETEEKKSRSQIDDEDDRSVVSAEGERHAVL
jgi:hypothetical protein